MDKGIVARLGGDEFVLVINDENVVKHIEQFEQSIHQAINASFNVQATQFNITTSIGITISNRKCLNHSLVLRTVDEALYEVKRNGKSSTYINITTV